MLNERLKIARNNANHTQDDVAEYLNVKRQTYSAYETGKSLPDSKTLNMIAKYFDVSADYLLDNTDNPAPKTMKNYITSEELLLLEKLRKLDPDKRAAIETLLD